MEIIGRISKGSKMDQIYIPKNRIGLTGGEYVLIIPLKEKIEKAAGKTRKQKFKPYFYNIKNLEPIKLRIIEEIFNLIEKKEKFENIIITGSFLEQGFSFNDIDILLVSEKKINTETIKYEIENLIGIKTHIILLNSKSLYSGLSFDPLYILMLSKCVSSKRFIFNIKRKINYKLLDLNLLKSKSLIDNFEILNGNEKYYLILNMISILLFFQNKKLSKEIVNKEIEKLFSIKIQEIKENRIKPNFLKKYKKIYNKTFNLIISNINKNDKQK